MDRAVGEILDALDRNGLTGNTLVISTKDHGVAFPLMKCNLEDSGWGVSLIMRGPGGFSGGKVIEALVSHLDIYPTLCDLAGVAHPAWLEGKSMLPILRGEANEINDEVFAEVTYHAAYEPQRAVRTDRWKYVRRFGDKHTPVQERLAAPRRPGGRVLGDEVGVASPPCAERWAVSPRAPISVTGVSQDLSASGGVNLRR